MSIENMDLDIDFVKKEQNEFKLKPIHRIDVELSLIEKATFGMGCYWAAEALFGATCGILSTRVGYSGGKLEFSQNDIADHTETIEITYNPEIISYEKLLRLFWNNHEYDYTVKTKRKYMSLILYHNEDQKKIANNSKNYEQIKRKPQTIQTVIQKASTFYPSEDRQQKYKLQQHKDLFDSLELNSELLQTSYVATKLNGYIVGVGDLQQFSNESKSFGLTPTQLDYVKFYIKQNEKSGLSC